jgi:hypothetical protein
MGLTCTFVATPDASLDVSLASPESLRALANEAFPLAVDIDRSWHAIHFLLTGSADATEGTLATVIFGAEVVGDPEDSEGLRLLRGPQVVEVADSLRPLTRAVVAARWNAAALDAAEIYPIEWQPEGDDAREYVLDHYVALRDFYLAAASRGDAVLTWIW